MNEAPDNSWFTVTIRFDREYGSIEISRPYVHEIEIMDGMFILRDENGVDMEQHPFNEVDWYEVKPNEQSHQDEHDYGGDQDAE
jgi:hypothetical protein